MKSTRLFCAITECGYRDFFSNPLGVKMCGHGTDVITEVIVRETLKHESPMQFAWWNNGKGEFSLVFPRRLLIDTCFPYGVDFEEYSDEVKKAE